MFFYNESAEAAATGLTYSVSPSTLSFTQNGQQLTFDVTATGTGGDNYAVSSDNSNFTVSPTSGGASGGDVVTVTVTFTGNDNTQFGTITFNGDNYGSVTVQVDSSGYSSGGLPGDGGPGGGSEPPPGP